MVDRWPEPHRTRSDSVQDDRASLPPLPLITYARMFLCRMRFMRVCVFIPPAVTLHLLMNHKLQYCPEISYLTFMFATNSYRERWLLKRPFMQVHSKFFTLYFCLEMQSNNNDEDKKLEWYISASQLGECLFCLSPDTIVNRMELRSAGWDVCTLEKYDLSSFGKHGWLGAGGVRTRDKCGAAGQSSVWQII